MIRIEVSRDEADWGARGLRIYVDNLRKIAEREAGEAKAFTLNKANAVDQFRKRLEEALGL